jgi:LysR family glycine cleavage system transcriptional activator
MSSKPLARIPSLDLLRTWVAVGRRSSITQAAADLYLTQSAVSKQVRQLEDALGTALLVRGHRSVTLTAAGEQLFQCADECLRALQGVVDAITLQPRRNSVTITASIGMTALWILPRLLHFQQQHPDVDVRVVADNRVHGLATPDIDLAIRYCAARDAPSGAVRLFDETLVPVAHPSLRAPWLATPEQLASQVLLEFDLPSRPWLHWHGWLQARGWPLPHGQRILRYNQYDQVIQAALAGQGIALGRYELIAPMLHDGRLVALAEHDPTLSPFSYWLVTFPAAQARDGAHPDSALNRFSRWLLAQAQATPHDTP